MPETHRTDPPFDLVLVTGPAGAGRTTAIRALEDAGFEAIDNMPLTLLPRLLGGPPLERPLALGVDPRTRDFTVPALLDLAGDLAARTDVTAALLYIDCATDVLLRRFSETRRRHPLAADDGPEAGIAREKTLLQPVLDRADHLIDTTALSPHDLRAEVQRMFGASAGARMSVSVQSFSYKRGLPISVDMALDVRFLQNPHWEPALRPLDGRAEEVVRFVESDPRYADFYDRVIALILSLLPAYLAEGKSHFSIGFGCTGGQHRSVAVSERVAKALAAEGWQVSIRHRELEGSGPAKGA